MRKASVPVTALQRDYERLRQSLAAIGYVSQGSVVDRSRLRTPRFGYQWTRKVKGKTVTVALSQEEYEALSQAIANQRKVTKTFRQMEKLSRRILFHNRARGARHKPLRQRVLGLI